MNAPNPIPRCDTCRYWDHVQHEYENMGYCRANPPTVVLPHSGNFIIHSTNDPETVWPETTHNEFCAFHTPHPPAS